MDTRKKRKRYPSTATYKKYHQVINKYKTRKQKNQKTRGELFTDDNPATTIHGYGFNTPKRVKYTLDDLAMRDIGYQFQVVNTMLQRGRQVLRRTHNTDKQNQISAGLRLYEDWITDYHRRDRYRTENHPYLPLSVIRRYQGLADEYRIPRREYEPFLREYSTGKTPAELRLINIDRGISTARTSISVDKYRNSQIFKIIGKRDINDLGWLYTTAGGTNHRQQQKPTARHIRLIMLGYSPDASIKVPMVIR